VGWSMCGIFGVAFQCGAGAHPARLRKILEHVADSAESRGKDSSGLVLRHVTATNMDVFKGSLRISELLLAPEVSDAVDRFAAEHAAADRGVSVAVGHSRLVTNGSQLRGYNNQPVVKEGIIGIHNGIITNEAEIWARHPRLKREYEIDTESLLALIASNLEGEPAVSEAVNRAAEEIQGTYSLALLFRRLPVLALATNNGSLYYLTDYRSFLVFASEAWPLAGVRRMTAEGLLRQAEMVQVPPGSCVEIRLDEFGLRSASTGNTRGGGREYRNRWSSGRGEEPADEGMSIEVFAVEGKNPRQELVLDTEEIARASVARMESELLEYNVDRISVLRRCTRCILPETFPHISFDENGVCNYCHHYRLRNQPRSLDELLEIIEPYRRVDDRPDCIVPFSGGRDSTYALHVITTELRLNPVAFTYDWGMVTDLARRNIARVCGELGVENIIVAANIYRKRDNIRRNVLAWLRNPVLGMVPLFMAGDKYFYYYASKVARQTGIRLNIWGINPLENTDFKVGFLGVSPDFNKKHIYSLSLMRKIRLLRGSFRELLRNPAYVNRSVVDSFGGFLSRSVMPHTDYYHLYDFKKWDEDEIEEILFGTYDWERAVDTQTTWRIGDGTAAFYNYIYCTVAGFSEHDTFRSNQIREGQLSRGKALSLTQRDNEPRYPTIKWYLSIIGVDYDATIRRINSIPKLY